MAKKKPAGRREYVRVRVPTAADVEVLRNRIAAKGPLWDQWEYKLHRDRIIIYDPVVPMNPDTGKVDPALRYLRMHLRVSPVPQGPFELEYRRHTEQWWPLRVTGTIEQIADAVASGRVPMTQPMDQFDHDRQPPAGGG